MKITKEFKMIEGQKVPLIEAVNLKRKVTLSKGHTSASIHLPRRFEGFDAQIKIIAPMPFNCIRCVMNIQRPENFSPKPNLCRSCFEAIEILKTKKGNLNCKKCGKEISEKEYKFAWDELICEPCWIKDAEDYSKRKEEEPKEK